MNAKEAVAFIHNRTSFGVKPGLERTRELLRLLGNPQENGLRFIHIAGTNGKGSSAAMLAAILSAAGCKTGLFTSPHLQNYTERFQINGVEMPREELAFWVTKVAAAAKRMEAAGFAPPTEFEIGTAVAFCYFAAQKVAWAVMETGLGGELDSTNVLQAELVLITSIAWDHMDYLGHTLTAIAAAKAGIIKNRAPVFCGELPPEAKAVIAEKAAKMQAPVYYLGEEISYIPRGQADNGTFYFDFAWQGTTLTRLSLSLLGRHQIANASLAVAAALQLGISAETIRRGLAKAKWPGRLEIVRETPLVVLDGAHNEAGFRALLAAMQDLWPQKKIIGLFAVLDDKEAGLLAEIFAKLGALVITKAPSSRAAHWLRVGTYAPTDLPVYEIEDIRAAYHQAKALCAPEDLLLAAGSLYMIGALRGIIQEEETKA